MKHTYNQKMISEMRKFSFNLFSSFFCLLLILSASNRIFAQGDLLISPLRIIFEGSKKSQEINLANVGKDTAVYAISIVDIRMKDDGGFEVINTPDSGQRFAGPYLRFFPRKVTLAPNEAQVVKIQLVKTNELTEGEYRSHLYFRAVPEDKPQGDAPSKKDTGISIHLTPIFGITIPVIIRTGDCKADVSFSDLSVDYSSPDTPKLNLTFNRNGNISAYGDLKVTYISPSGSEKQLNPIKGIGIYTPNRVRHSQYVLDEKNIDYHKGKLRLVYAQQMGDKSFKNVEADVDLK